MVDKTAGHGMLSFMDAFSWYKQIKMAEEDREKTSFSPYQGTFCYKVMPFLWSKECRGDLPASHDCALEWYDEQGNGVYVDDMIDKSCLGGTPPFEEKIDKIGKLVNGLWQSESISIQSS